MLLRMTFPPSSPRQTCQLAKVSFVPLYHDNFCPEERKFEIGACVPFFSFGRTIRPLFPSFVFSQRLKKGETIDFALIRSFTCFRPFHGLLPPLETFLAFGVRPLYIIRLEYEAILRGRRLFPLSFSANICPRYEAQSNFINRTQTRSCVLDYIFPQCRNATKSHFFHAVVWSMDGCIRRGCTWLMRENTIMGRASILALSPAQSSMQARERIDIWPFLHRKDILLYLTRLC